MMALKMTRAVPEWAAKRRPTSNGSNGCRCRLIIRTGRTDGLSGGPISHIGHCARDRLFDKGCVNERNLGEKALCATPYRNDGLGQKDTQTNDSRRVKRASERANCRLTNGMEGQKGVAWRHAPFLFPTLGVQGREGRRAICHPLLTLSLGSPQSICNCSL